MRHPINEYTRSNLHSISHRFQVNWGSYFRLVALFNTLVRGEPLNSRLRNLASRN